MDNKLIEHNLNFYIVQQDLFEPDDVFQERVQYILLNLDNDNYDNLIKKSKIISNIKNYNCEYSEKITDLLK
jgi:hypothetical protein